MKEIGPIAEVDHKITMKEIGPIAGIDCKNTMTEINHAEGIDLQNITKMIMKESIIVHFRAMEIGENTKIIIKTNIGMNFSMIMIDLMIWIILMVEIGHTTETGHIVETGTTPENTKETGHMLEIDYMSEMIHIVEIDHETTIEMSIRRKIINVREDLEIIMKMPMRTGMVRININTNTEMTDMTKLVVGQGKKPCPHGDKNCDSSNLELEELYKKLPWMTSEEVIAIRSMLMTFEYTNEVMDSTCLMAARVEYAIN